MTRLTWLWPLVFTLVLAGCVALSRVEPGTRPADFKLLVFVDSASDRNTLYVLDPDRVLRVAVGRDVTGRLYPPPTATLTPGQMDALWTLTRPLLMARPDAPRGIDLVLVNLTITANGAVHRTVTTPQEPGVGELLAELDELAGRGR